MSSGHLIIGGVSKAGTTSVFRYLSAHPQIRPSIRKELSFFFVNRDKSGDDLSELYEEKFESEAGLTSRVSLEASPRYLQDGTDVARAIHRTLPNVRLLFLLRDPAERLISYYRSKHKQGGRIGTTMDFDDFVEMALQAASTSVDALQPELVPIATEVGRGRYAEQVEQYRQVFPRKQINISFYDNLKSDPLQLMQEICHFIGIDETFFDDFQFTVENKSRAHRWQSLRRVAGDLNLRFEPLLNKAPALKRRIRALYNFINVDRNRDIEAGGSGRAMLAKYYEPGNRNLAHLLRQEFAMEKLPDWLSRY